MVFSYLMLALGQASAPCLTLLLEISIFALKHLYIIFHRKATTVLTFK